RARADLAAPCASGPLRVDGTHALCFADSALRCDRSRRRNVRNAGSDLHGGRDPGPRAGPADGWPSERSRSIELKLASPVLAVLELRLAGLQEHAILEDQGVHLGPHEAAPAVFGGAHDGLPPDIEAGVHDDRTAGLRAEGVDDLPVERVDLPPHGLDAGG